MHDRLRYPRLQSPDHQIRIDADLVVMLLDCDDEPLDRLHERVPGRIQFRYVLRQAAPQDVEAVSRTGLRVPGEPQTLGTVGHLEESLVTGHVGFAAFL